MKVGTDGVLLGAWAGVGTAGRVLDIGTGTGLIALMAAQRNPTACIDAIEIEPVAYGQALENVSESPWADRIRLHLTSLQDFNPPIRYDSIVCNPPFFKNSTKTPDSGRTMARHADTLPHEELIAHSARLLSEQGSFCFILPPAETLALLQTARQYRLYPFRITSVLPNPGKPPKRYLVHLVPYRTETTENELIIEISRHRYSQEYKELTQDFYL